MSTSSKSSSSSVPLAFDPSLLQPIVRSKRTPMACTQCRQRQVKCTGNIHGCERCAKKGLECVYMSLSDQRASSGGSISRTSTPGSSGRSSSSRIGHQSQWSQGTQGAQAYPTGAPYPAPQGWREPSSTHGSSAGQYVPPAAQTFHGGQIGFQAGYGSQQTAYGQGPALGGAVAPGGADLFAQGYGQPGYAGGTTYNAYGHAMSSSDPRYAYPPTQMGGVSGGDQPTSTFGNDYSSHHMFFDAATGQMVSADVATAQQWTENTQQGFQGHSFPGQNLA
ncbi:hypothetical protein BD413DRAFT_55775 [Trametes elegans]|nr:hypothetical protein BD413DRAFT_55775 [Trametes elegans]